MAIMVIVGLETMGPIITPELIKEDLDLADALASTQTLPDVAYGSDIPAPQNLLHLSHRVQFRAAGSLMAHKPCLN
jgi:hypothetical protein